MLDRTNQPRHLPERPILQYILKQSIMTAAFNAAMNFGYTYYLWGANDRIGLFDESRVAIDLAMTPVVIALLSTLLGTPSFRSWIRKNRLPSRGAAMKPGVFGLLPSGVVARSLVAAALAFPLLGLPLLGSMLPLAGVSVEPLMACAAKALISVAMTLLIVPLVIRAALADLAAEQPQDTILPKVAA